MQLNMRLEVEEVNVTLEFPSSKEEGGEEGKKGFPFGSWWLCERDVVP